MEWNFNVIPALVYVLIFSMTVWVQSGPLGGYKTHDDLKLFKAVKRISIIQCQPEQSYFCLNLTHFSPCVSSDSLNVEDTFGSKLALNCGRNRCCQLSGKQPCTYSCPHSDLHLNMIYTRRILKNADNELDMQQMDVNPIWFPPSDDESLTHAEKIKIIKDETIIKSMKLFLIKDPTLNRQWSPTYRDFCPLMLTKETTDYTEQMKTTKRFSEKTNAFTIEVVTNVPTKTNFFTRDIVTDHRSETTVVSQTHSPSTKWMRTTTEETVSKLQCVRKEKIPCPVNCNHYYQCSYEIVPDQFEGWVMSREYHCPDGFFFDYNKQGCRERHLVKCAITADSIDDLKDLSDELNEKK